MSDSPMVTEAEARKRERAAFIAGVDAQRDQDRRHRERLPDPVLWDRTAAAAKRFPPVRVVRQRVVRCENWEFRANGTVIEYRAVSNTPGEWRLVGDYKAGSMRPVVTPERVAIFADLFARPTEEVDE